MSTSGSVHDIETKRPANDVVAAEPEPKPLAASKNGRSMASNGNGAPKKGVRPSLDETMNFASRQGSGFLRKSTLGGMDVQGYFVGPRDPNRHSKWPFFLRLHGSVVPKLVLPLLFVGAWATAITVISKQIPKHSLGIDSVLLTVLGFVVGLSLSFRSSTAYERYNEGRKYWASLILTSRNFARLIWIHVAEREGDLGKEDVLGKLTFINLIVAYAIATKHKLRFEPYANYEDIQNYVGHLDTFAGVASSKKNGPEKKKTPWKAAGEYLGVSFAESNPRKELKRAQNPLGHLPLEILNHLSSYVEGLIQNGTLRAPVMQTHAMNNLATYNEILTGCERILATPLPLAYSISISQITWIYVLILPFQLYSRLQWITIPATMIAAYIILGLAAIGREIENPFGNDVNDLPLDSYCDQLQAELAIITSHAPQKSGDFIAAANNLVLYPLSLTDYSSWKARSLPDIRAALYTRAVVAGAPAPQPLTNEPREKMKKEDDSDGIA